MNIRRIDDTIQTMSSAEDKLKIKESAENYLETILMLSMVNNKVRAIDIVKALNFSKPSVSVAMKNLKEDGYILVDEKGHIELSKEGLVIAKAVYERHTLLVDWLIQLGVDPQTAAFDACRMEHTISEKSFKAIKKYIKRSTDK